MVLKPGSSRIFQIEKDMPESFCVVPPVENPDTLQLLQPLFRVFTRASAERWWFLRLLQKSFGMDHVAELKHGKLLLLHALLKILESLV